MPGNILSIYLIIRTTKQLNNKANQQINQSPTQQLKKMEKSIKGTQTEQNLLKAFESTASQTAWGLLGLLPFVAAGDAAVGRAVDWLLERQQPDGTWEEREFTGTGFPGDFFIKYHEYRNYFPLLALAMARQKDSGVALLFPAGRVAAG